MGTAFESLTTEQVNAKTKHIDICSTEKILERINDEDMLVPKAVKKEIQNITKAVDTIVKCIKNGGRLFYIGAGTSGRIGILDAVECPPTFGVGFDLIQGIIAGGNEAIFKAVEGAEDSEEQGKSIIHEKKITNIDAVVGITASGITPYVVGAVREAKKIGAVVIGISNNHGSIIEKEADISITPIVGSEVIMGSTRMKAGTSQKLVLNMITTAVMIKLGKVYGNLMVDLQLNNKKLEDRAIRIVEYATGKERKEVEKYLKQAGHNPKVAIVMIITNVTRQQAEKFLNQSDGFVTKAIEFAKKIG